MLDFDFDALVWWTTTFSQCLSKKCISRLALNSDDDGIEDHVSGCNDGEDDCDDMKVAMIMTIGNDDNLGDDDVVGRADDGDQG